MASLGVSIGVSFPNLNAYKPITKGPDCSSISVPAPTGRRIPSLIRGNYCRRRLAHPRSIIMASTTETDKQGIKVVTQPSESQLSELGVRSWPNSRRWDSNAETAGDEDEMGDLDDSVEQWTEALEDYIDSIWIFKVLGSFGWMLPFIIISMLLTTGLKAFLLALAVPIGQSIFAFAINKYQHRNKITPKWKARVKRGSRPGGASSARNVRFKGIGKQDGKRDRRKVNKEYDQSWGGNVYASNSDRRVSDFGGWDELDDATESRVGGDGMSSRS